MELNKELLQDALGEVNKVIAQANGEYQEAVLGADAYYQRQTNLAAATIAEGTAEAACVTKMRAAIMNEAGLIQVKTAGVRNRILPCLRPHHRTCLLEVLTVGIETYEPPTELA